jgi:RNase adaptor protein for sRNA GlmZ degradation
MAPRSDGDTHAHAARRRALRGAPRAATSGVASDPQTPVPRTRPYLVLTTFGFKYGAPNANYFFDVSFLKNPAREEQWGLFAEPDEAMRAFVLDQQLCQDFLRDVTPLIRTVLRCDDDVRVAIGCNAGRHRSRIVAEELARRLTLEGVVVKLIHREAMYA